MAVSTLLMKLIATDDQPFDVETRKLNNEKLLDYLEVLRKGTTNFKAVKYLANALNYVHGFNKNGFIGEDIEELHNEAARALGAASQRKPWKATDEECEKIKVIIGIWDQILEQASEKLVREIQHEIDFVCPEAKALREAERKRIARHSHRKPKKKTKR